MMLVLGLGIKESLTL